MEDVIRLKLPLHKFDGALWSYHVSIPNNVAEQLSSDGKKRLLVRINGNEALHLALMPDGKGGQFIMFNRKTIKSYKLSLGELLDVELQKDRSKYGMPMPDELGECLHQDPEGEVYFEALTPGKKRGLIHIVSKIKSTNLRIHKSLIILQHLKTNKGILDYKALNEAFRRGNQDPDAVFR